MQEQKNLLCCENITKEFSGTPVLTGVSFSLNKGEILGLVGENGAGKTTLMGILFGMPVIKNTGGYGGTIKIDGNEVKFESPLEALEHGIGMVHQEFSLIPGFTAAENIMLNRELQSKSIISDIFSSRLALLRRPEMRKRAQGVLNDLGVSSIDAQTLVAQMPVGHKQFIEIAREIDRDNIKLLVLDEPTAVLTETEAEILLKAMKSLSEKGISIIFISHRLKEILDICDKIVVLRDGKSVADLKPAETSIEKIAEYMVGREVTVSRIESNHNSGKPILEVDNLWVDMPGELVNDASFTVNEGEIFGIGGLAGQGKVGIANGIMGIFPSGGSIKYNGEDIELNNTKKILETGFAFVSEDRRGVGLLLDESLDWNIAFTAMQVQKKFLKKYLGGLIRLRDENAMKKLAEQYIEMLQIKCTGSSQKAKELSGGNQQKLCLAKAFCLDPKVLFVAEPTRGIDIGAKALVLNALRKLNKDHGTTIIMVSSELEELRSICDRIAIVFDGRIAGILPSTEESKEFALYMAGVK